MSSISHEQVTDIIFLLKNKHNDNFIHYIKNTPIITFRNEIYLDIVKNILNYLLNMVKI
jgi:hypothetical protein